MVVVCALPAAGRKLTASRSTPYVNITFDFDCFASLSLPTTLSVRPPCQQHSQADTVFQMSTVVQMCEPFQVPSDAGDLQVINTFVK